MAASDQLRAHDFCGLTNEKRQGLCRLKPSACPCSVLIAECLSRASPATGRCPSLHQHGAATQQHNALALCRRLAPGTLERLGRTCGAARLGHATSAQKGDAVECGAAGGHGLPGAAAAAGGRVAALRVQRRVTPRLAAAAGRACRCRLPRGRAAAAAVAHGHRIASVLPDGGGLGGALARRQVRGRRSHRRRRRLPRVRIKAWVGRRRIVARQGWEIGRHDPARLQPSSKVWQLM